MRSIIINVPPLFEPFARKSKFIDWVNIPKSDLPLSIQVFNVDPQQQTNKIVVKLVYKDHKRIYEKNINENTTMLLHFSGCIGGFKTCIEKFSGELDEVLAWLEQQNIHLNSRREKNNYRLAREILHAYRDLLFIPAQ